MTALPPPPPPHRLGGRRGIRALDDTASAAAPYQERLLASLLIISFEAAIPALPRATAPGHVTRTGGSANLHLG